MDSIWSLRFAYDEARQVKSTQDAFCQKAEAGLWESLDDDFPQDLKWEMLVDVLRGKVKVADFSLSALLKLTSCIGLHSLL